MSQRKTNLREMTGRWWLIQTRPQFERRFATDLEQANVDHFLPLAKVRCTRQDRGRLRSIVQIKPLFPTYLFVNFPKGDRPSAITARSIANPKLINVVDQHGLAMDLANLQIALDSDNTLTPRPTIQHGQRVRVVEGACMGMEGEAVRQDDHHIRIQLSVCMLGQAVDVDVPIEKVEAC